MGVPPWETARPQHKHQRRRTAVERLSPSRSDAICLMPQARSLAVTAMRAPRSRRSPRLPAWPVGLSISTSRAGRRYSISFCQLWARGSLEHIEKLVDPGSTGFQYEKQRIEAYFDFCRLNPSFLRIYHEAAVFAPHAYRKHFRRLADSYRDTINKSRERGELPLFEEKDIESLIHILMGARSYLSLLYASGRTENPVSTLIDVYLKVVKSGVFGGTDEPLKPKRPIGS